MLSLPCNKQTLTHRQSKSASACQVLILPLHTITCFLLVCVLTESSELWGVWPDHGRPGEADRCSQHPAQRDWIVQPSALCQLCRQQGERKHTHMMQHSVFTQQLIQTVNVLLNLNKNNFLSAILSFRRIIQPWRNSTTIYWWVVFT